MREAEPLFRESIAICQQIGAAQIEKQVQASFGSALHANGRPAAAAAAYDRAIALARAAADRQGEGLYTGMSHGTRARGVDRGTLSARAYRRGRRARWTPSGGVSTADPRAAAR